MGKKKERITKETNEEILEKALYRKALGYVQDEVIEEYAIQEDGAEVLVKRKITKKPIAPDIPAAKVLLGHFISKKELEFQNLSDEELLDEKIRLLKELASLENEEEQNETNTD